MTINEFINNYYRKINPATKKEYTQAEVAQLTGLPLKQVADMDIFCRQNSGLSAEKFSAMWAAFQAVSQPAPVPEGMIGTPFGNVPAGPRTIGQVPEAEFWAKIKEMLDLL